MLLDVLSFGQWWVVELLLLLGLGAAVDFVAASAWPTPTPPNRVPAANVVAMTPRRILGVTPGFTSFVSSDELGPSEP